MAKEQKRDYNFSDAVLKQFADQLKTSITRDAGDFATRGVNGATITNYQQLIDDFAATTTDEESMGFISNEALQKDAAREVLIKAVRKVRGIADVTFKGEGLYNSFGFEDMLRLDDNDLCRMSARVHRVATKFKADMAGDGLTEQMLTDLETASKDFDEKIDKVVASQEDRDIATQHRIVTGNILFAEIRRLLKIGKALYEDTDEAKYNDYMLPPDEGGENKTPPPTT